MTKEEFALLSPEDQEHFTNSGGVISSGDCSHSLDMQADGCCVSPKEMAIAQPSLSQPATFYDNRLDGIMIKDPVDLLCTIDPDIASGEVTLHPWQIQFMLDFANEKHNQDTPFQAVVRACNGSGKDIYIIAACAVWICIRYKNTVAPTTSSSGFQLDNQTCKHTRRLCEAFNRHFQTEFWDCKYRSYTMRFDPKDHEFDSQVLCYATDEPGKAEGFHPVGKGKRMAIFLSEDKTIPDEINDAINKCTGYTHRVHASTPGKSYGHFHDYCKMAISRKAIKSVKEVGPTDWIEYHVTSDMCPHLGKNYKEKAAKNIPGGANSDAYRSQVDAEFGNGDGEMTVIPYTYVWQACRNSWNTPWYPEEFNTAGLDLSDGGAETALAVRNGNKLIKLDPFKFDNQGDRIKYLVEKFKDYNLDHPKARINGDCVGIGKPDLDRLKELGWKNIRFIDSRASAYNKTVYKNHNSEIWFQMAALLERHLLILLLDQTLEKQLASRHYKLMDGKIHQMLSKQEERRLGHPSPDRADAVNLCFWGYKSPVASEELDAPFTQEEFIKEHELIEEIKPIFTLRSWSQGEKVSVKSRINDRVSDLDDIREELRIANMKRINNK